LEFGVCNFFSLNFILLYGPPGVGKSTVGKELAARLEREFFDSDPMIENLAGRSIPHIFSQLGEAEFRRLEAKVCAGLSARRGAVIALGGGALLNANVRAAFERNGLIVCLRADADELLRRTSGNSRPLLAGDNPAERLNALLATRRAFYDSFSIQVGTKGKSIEQVVDEIESMVVPRSLPVNAPGLRHEILLGYGLLDSLPDLLDERGLTGPAIVVTDENIATALPITNYQLPITILPAGEQHKTLDTVRALYDALLQHGLDRSGIVIAIGGGVIGDLAGFAAATFMRGVRWVNAPTTLLAMVDASLGGKTGVDLPQGKNLAGAFHPPSLVVADPFALTTLPQAERAAGMAEVIKHGVIGDAGLFEMIESGAAFGGADQIARAMAVKIRVVEADPFEKGERATLNLGHTIGHGVEAASEYSLRHGEAVAVGMVAESRLAERLGLAERGLAQRIARACAMAGLPVKCSGLNPDRIREAMSSDKKKSGGRLKFALPKKIGEVVWGVEADEAEVMSAVRAACDAEE